MSRSVLTLVLLILLSFPRALLADEPAVAHGLLRLLNNRDVPTLFVIEGLAGIHEAQVPAKSSLFLRLPGPPPKITLVMPEGQTASTAPLVTVEANRYPGYGLQTTQELPGLTETLPMIACTGPLPKEGIRVLQPK